MIKNLFQSVLDKRETERQAELYRNLIRHEAKIGGQLFGPVPKGGRREFFCLDEHTWVWHEEWVDGQGQHRSRTTRYDIRPTGILKAQDGTHYQYVSEDEAVHLFEAAKQYEKRVNQELYKFA
jgi:hypothetical protein